MRIYILGVGGTLMSGVAILALEKGHEVRGCDKTLYPPMSEQLKSSGIDVDVGEDPGFLDWMPDAIIIGNTISESHPVLQRALTDEISISSAPAWLHENILQDRKVIAITGTHGKTTASSIVVSLLRGAGDDCGYLIAGQLSQWPVNAALGSSEYFVIEADEYDTSYLDKQPKFLHYFPYVLVINNLEFDHADIYANLSEIQDQFKRLVALIPPDGFVITPDDDVAVNEVVNESINNSENDSHASFVNFTGPKANWQFAALSADLSQFKLSFSGNDIDKIKWNLVGEHNVSNALAALTVMTTLGFSTKESSVGLHAYQPVKRRLQDYGERNGIRLIDDFAHHPTAIAATINACRNKFPDQRLLVCVGFDSYTMREGLHQEVLPAAMLQADHVFLIKNARINWDLDNLAKQLKPSAQVVSEAVAWQEISDYCKSGDVILILSNRDQTLIREGWQQL